MSIHFVSGKPGGGKSLYGLKLIYEELLYGTRPIVTNLAVRVGALNAFYQRTYDNPRAFYRVKLPSWLWWLYGFLPEWLIAKLDVIAVEEIETRFKSPRLDDICSRVHLITDEEMAVFFTKRPDGEVEHITNERWRAGARPDYSVVKDHGVFFCLDEVHIPFNSRAWADTGAEVLFYLSQHRKLGDDVICITQSVANVDKQFRSVAQDFSYIRNLGKEVVGMMRLPLRFVRKTYAQMPTADGTAPMNWAFFSLDVDGLASCYDTAKGVGIHGRGGADTKERKSGIHWLWFAIGVPLICLLVFKFCPNLLARWLSHPPVPAVAPGAVVKPAAARVSPAGEPSLPVVTREPGYAFPQAGTNGDIDQVREPALFCRGFVILDGHPTAFLSDGRVVEPPDLVSVSRTAVKIGTNVLLVMPARVRSDPDRSPSVVAFSIPQIPPRRQFPVCTVTVIGPSRAGYRPQALSGIQRMSASLGGSSSPSVHTLSP